MSRPMVFEQLARKAYMESAESGIPLGQDRCNMHPSLDGPEWQALQVDFPQYNEFLRRKGVPEYLLGHSVVEFYNGATHRTDAGGFLSNAPAHLTQPDGSTTLHFPWISIAVGSSEHMNLSFRHEMRHTLQHYSIEQRPPSAPKSWVPHRMAGAAFGAVSLDILLHSAQQIPAAEGLPWLIAGNMALCFAALGENNSLRGDGIYFLTPKEQLAQRFARKHADFNPISLQS